MFLCGKISTTLKINNIWKLYVCERKKSLWWKSRHIMRKKAMILCFVFSLKYDFFFLMTLWPFPHNFRCFFIILYVALKLHHSNSKQIMGKKKLVKIFAASLLACYGVYSKTKLKNQKPQVFIIFGVIPPSVFVNCEPILKKTASLFSFITWTGTITVAGPHMIVVCATVLIYQRK